MATEGNQNSGALRNRSAAWTSSLNEERVLYLYSEIKSLSRVQRRIRFWASVNLWLGCGVFLTQFILFGFVAALLFIRLS